MIGVGALAEPN